MKRLRAHLDEVGETYTEHMGHAAGFSWLLLGAACACAVHAVAPFLLVHTASDRVARLQARMARRAPQAAAPRDSVPGGAPAGEPLGQHSAP